MKVIVDFKYTEPVIATVYNENGIKFFRSEVKVNIPPRPFYEPSNSRSCTEAKYLKWKDKVVNKISLAVLKSIPKELYGTINTFVNMEKHHGL